MENNGQKEEIYASSKLSKITINGTDWTKKANCPTCTQWTSKYYSSDGDGVVLYIENDQQQMTLSCFSGIGASIIKIDRLDFGIFRDKLKMAGFARIDFETQCCLIADYFCKLFCEKM